jgi:hypothetical protein
LVNVFPWDTMPPMGGWVPRRLSARIGLGLLTLACAAFAPPAADAARPGTLIANGQAPSVAVDATGTGYVVYNDEPPGQVDEPVGLCVIPRGASHCSSNRDVIIDGQSGEAQPALISATGNGQLEIASGRCCFNSNVAIVSSNGGATFSDPASIGDIIYFDGAIGPGGQVLFVDDSIINGIFSEVGSPATPADGSATLFDPAPGGSAIAGWAGGTPVVVGAGTETAAAIYSGSGDVNDGANWNNVRVPGSTSNPSMASGPVGLFLLQDTGDFQGRLTIRRFEGNGFGRAHVIVNANSTEGTALAEDNSGRLVAIWYENGTIFASASRDRGVRWSRPRAIATDVQLPSRLNAAVAPDGSGWLVYDLNAGSEVRVVPVSIEALLGIRHPAHHRKRRHRRHHMHHRHHKHHRRAHRHHHH